jgi:DNA-binding beta-propeller fold protein YncE
MTWGINLVTSTVIGSIQMGQLPDELALSAGQMIFATTSVISASDQWVEIVITVREFLDL